MKARAIYIDDENTPDLPYHVDDWDFDNPNFVTGVFISFGNGLYDEIRIVPDSMETFDLINSMMLTGGYQVQSGPKVGHSLYQKGDTCYGPDGDAFIFVAPC